MNTKRTGGVFDPAARPLYFAAGQIAWTPPAVARFPESVLVAVNDLKTPRAEARGLTAHLDAGRRVLLDSGVFELANGYAKTHGMTLAHALAIAPEDLDGFAELYDRYTSVVARHGDRLWGWIELDQGGRVNKTRVRGYLEAGGQIPIPVYHPLNDGWDYFDYLAQNYDRVCFGNVVAASPAVRARILHTLWERHRQYPDLWVHALGIYPSELFLAAPADSCDASSWLGPLRWGERATESSMLAATRALPRPFLYDTSVPPGGPRSRDKAIGVLVDSLTATNRVWSHARARAGDLSGPPYPTYLPGEDRPCPST